MVFEFQVRGIPYDKKNEIKTVNYTSKKIDTKFPWDWIGLNNDKCFFQINFEGNITEFEGTVDEFNIFKRQFFKNVERKKKLESL